MPDYIKSYSININGKTVEFIIKADDISNLKLGNVRVATIKWLISQHPNNPHIRMISAYLENKIREFLEYLTEITVKIFISIAKKYSQFIISEKIQITIEYSNKVPTAVAAYDPTQSDIDSPYFVISPPNLASEMLKYENRDMLYEALFHEFVHHLDREKIVQGILMGNRIYHHVQDPGASIYLVSWEFLMLREEGVASFVQHLESDRRIWCFMKSFFKLFVNQMKAACKTLNINQLEIIHNQIVIDRTHHNMGAVMAAMIVLHDLFKNGKRFSVWIKTRGLIGAKDFNADRIKDFYTNESFDLVFTDIEADSIIIPVIKRLRSLSHIQFLKGYEEACRYFKVSPFINLKLYNYFKRKCWENYKRFMESQKS